MKVGDLVTTDIDLDKIYSNGVRQLQIGEIAVVIDANPYHTIVKFKDGKTNVYLEDELIVVTLEDYVNEIEKWKHTRNTV